MVNIIQKKDGANPEELSYGWYSYKLFNSEGKQFKFNFNFYWRDM